MKREIVDGSPTEEYDHSTGAGWGGTTDYKKVARTEERVLEETKDYRLLEITEHGYYGQGESTVDTGSGVSYGGGTGGEFVNTYRVKEWRDAKEDA